MFLQILDLFYGVLSAERYWREPRSQVVAFMLLNVHGGELAY